MTKIEFILDLQERLSGFPIEELSEQINFYSEMIDDRTEEGFSEEEAVAQLGSVKDIADKLISEIPFSQLVKERVKAKRKMTAWEIVLLALGSPVWLSLLIAVLAVIFSVYVALWSVVISLWAVFVSLVASGVGGAVVGAVIAFKMNVLTGVALIGAAFVCSGLSVLFFFGCKAVTKGMAFLTKKMALWIKLMFVRKEKNNV